MNKVWVVRLPTWLGDTMMALPTVRAVAHMANASLVLWGPPAFAELLSSSDVAFRYLPYRRRQGIAGISDGIHACAALRHHEPEVALLLPNAFEPALLARAAAIPRRIGYATDGRGPLLTDQVPEPRPRHAVHEAERFAALARHLGADVDVERDAGLTANDRLRGRAEEILPAGQAYLGIAAGSANTPAKRWPPAAYADLIGSARRHWDVTPVLLGSAADGAVNRKIGELAGDPVIDLSGCSLWDLAAALLRCRVVISNDSGAAHLAAALARPTVVLFGPTDAGRSGPIGPRVAVVQAGSFCQPCDYGDCPLDHRCMNDLTTAAVLGAVAPAWQGQP